MHIWSNIIYFQVYWKFFIYFSISENVYTKNASFLEVGWPASAPHVTPLRLNVVYVVLNSWYV